MSISSLGIGSGLDLNGLLDQLRDAERGKLKPIEQQREIEQTKISAYGRLESALSEFQSNASVLSNTSLYESLSTNTRGESVSAAADETAMPGSYNIDVTTLASRGTLASAGVTAPDTSISANIDQQMEFTFGDGSKRNVAITADSSLEDIRDAINADDNAGVNATIINDGSGTNEFRLALSSRETGADASISSFALEGTDLTPDGSGAEAGQLAITIADAAAATVTGINLVIDGTPLDTTGIDFATDVTSGTTLADQLQSLDAIDTAIYTDGELTITTAVGEAITIDGGSALTDEGVGVGTDGEPTGGTGSTGTHQAGTDANLNVNGITITSANNQVEGAIQGVTLNLQSEGASTVAVEQDTRAVREAVTGFVDSYNSLKVSIDELTSFNQETGQAGELNGDNTVRRVESTLRSALSGGVTSSGEGFSMLSDIGIAVELDGSLSVDEGRLDDAILNNQQALSNFFAGSVQATGLAEQIDTSIAQMLSSDGTVQGAINSSENRVESLNDRYTRTEQSIERTIGRYREQFSQLDAMIAQMNQTSDYLTNQFSALEAQMNQGR